MIYETRNPDDEKRARAYFESLISQKARIEVKKKARGKSLNQNSYFHVCLTAWGGHLGMTLAEIKQEVKMRLCPGIFEYEKRGRKFYHSWASLDSKQAATVTDVVRRTAMELDGFYIPEPYETELLQRMEEDASRYEAWQM